MRYFSLFTIIVLLVLATPALAVDDFYGPEGDEIKFDDSRRPDLGIGRDRARPDAVRPAAGESTWEEFHVQDVQVGEFMGRLYEVLTREEWLGQYPEVAVVAETMRAQGVFNLDNWHKEYAITGDRMEFLMSQQYADLDPESYYGKLLALPNRELRSLDYVTDDFMLYIGYHNFPAIVMIVLDEMMGNPAFSELMTMISDGEFQADDMKQVWGLLEAFQVDETLSNVFTGELAVVLYELPPLPQLFEGDVMPADFDCSVMIGLNGTDYIVELIDNYGTEIGLLERSYEGDRWHYYVMQGEEGLGLMFSDEMAIVTTNLEAARTHVHEAGGIEVQPCQYHFDLNIAALHDKIVTPATLLGMEELEGTDIVLPVEPMAYLVNLPESDALGHLMLTGSFESDAFTMKAEMKKAVVQYLVYYLGVALCGAAQAGAFN